MVQVVDYEEFLMVVKRLDKVESDNEFLKSLLLTNKWLTRSQAMVALGISDKTLKNLIDRKKIAYRYEGIKPFYEVDSIRSYLMDKKIESEIVEQRVITALSLGRSNTKRK